MYPNRITNFYFWYNYKILVLPLCWKVKQDIIIQEEGSRNLESVIRIEIYSSFFSNFVHRFSLFMNKLPPRKNHLNHRCQQLIPRFSETLTESFMCSHFSVVIDLSQAACLEHPKFGGNWKPWSYTGFISKQFYFWMQLRSRIIVTLKPVMNKST